MKMKKWIAMALAGLLIFGAFGCKNDSVVNSGDNQSQKQPQKQGTATETGVDYVDGSLLKVNVTETNKPFVQNGKSEYTVVLGSSDYAKEYGNLIVSHIKAATGCTLRIIDWEEETWSVDKKWIVVGAPKLFEQAGLSMPEEDIGDSGFHIKSAGDSVFINTKQKYGIQGGALAPYFNERNIHLSELTGEIIDEFYKYQMDRGVSANTVIHYHANIRKCLDQAFRDDLIPCNYAAKAHRPKKSEFISEYYNRDELLELFNVVKNKKIEFAVLMASYYGLRRSEIIGLKWSCIDFKNKMFIIRHTVTECRIDGKHYVVAKDRGKSKKSVRTLPLVPPIEKVLLNMKELEDAHKKFFGKNYNYKDDEYIYKDPNGERVKLDFIR